MIQLASKAVLVDILKSLKNICAWYMYIYIVCSHVFHM